MKRSGTSRVSNVLEWYIEYKLEDDKNLKRIFKQIIVDKDNWYFL